MYGLDYGGGNGQTLIHIGTRLVHNDTTLYSNMAENESSIVSFGDKLYVLDGTQYLDCDFTNVRDVSQYGTIPTTSIGRSPSRWWRNVSKYKPIEPSKKE